jgi:hypothetical protein
MFTAKAELEYKNSWVMAMMSDLGIIDYYRWWFWRERGYWLMRPKYGAHISVIRGKDEYNPASELYMDARPNLEIEFEYTNDMILHNDGYVWLPVCSEELKNVREECGFPREPIMPFHMTVGRVM